MTLLPGGFVQLLPIVERVAAVHYEHILEAARGALASGTVAPSEEEAKACLLRIYMGSNEEADWNAIENFMRAQVTEWFPGFSERPLLVDLVRRADRRKKGTGSKDSRRLPSHDEGLRLAKALLADTPGKGEISLDDIWEHEAASNLLVALLSPHMGEPSPEARQRYEEISMSNPVFREALRRSMALYRPDKAIFHQDLRWQRRADAESKLQRAKFKIAPHSPAKPAILVRNLQIQFVIRLLDRVGASPQGTFVSGIRIVGEALGLSEDTVKKILEMSFTVEMEKYSTAIAERLGLLGTTEA